MSELGAQRDGSGDASRVDRPAGRRRSDRIVGGGQRTQEVVDQALIASRNDRPVWLSGPEGSGREHLARAIHAWSRRASEPFVVVSCATISEALLAREIFGCAAGVHAILPEAYAGALGAAGAGTVFLDEFDRAPAAVRGRLAQALSETRYEREGNGEKLPIRARVTASTSADVTASPLGEVAQERLPLGPLAERREDVLPLAAHFLRLAADEQGITPVGFTADARNALLAESWSGNVRELAERVRQAVKLAGNGAITAEALLLSADGESVPSFKEAKRAFETRYVVGLLRRCGGNISHAARLAKKDRKDFYDVIRRTGVDPSDFR